MNKCFRGILITSFLLALCNFVFAQKMNLITKKFQNEIEMLMHEKNIPAFGIGIIKNGEIHQVKVFGELKKGSPAPDDAIFNVASLSKPISTVLTLHLVSSGNWDLDEPLYHYWIDPDVKDDPNHMKITSRHVFNHTTGFDNWRRMHSTGKLTFNTEPGTKIQYSGEGFEYLRRAMERKFGIPIEHLEDSLVFKPYGMKDTRLLWGDEIHYVRYAEEHNKEGKPYNLRKRTTDACASDDVLTSIEDYCLFSINVMNGTGLKPEVHKDMLRLQAIKNEKGGFALGWYIEKNFYNNEYVIMHDGSDAGVKTKVVLLPESKNGIVMFTNGDHGFDLINKVETEFFEKEN